MIKFVLTLSVLLGSASAFADSLKLTCTQNGEPVWMNVESTDCFGVEMKPGTSVVNKLVCDTGSAIGTARIQISVFPTRNGKSMLTRWVTVNSGRPYDLPAVQDDSVNLENTTCTLIKN